MTSEQLTTEMLNSRQDFVFEYLFNKFYRPLYVYACRITGNNLSADDIVQEAFIKYYYRAGVDATFYCEREILSYLFNAVRYECWDLFKRNSAQKRRWVNCYNETEQEDFFRDVIAAETIRTAYGLINDTAVNLPPQCKKVMLGLFIRHLTIRELSAQMGISVPAVKDYRKRGIAHIKQVIECGGRRTKDSGSQTKAKVFELLRKDVNQPLKNIAQAINISIASVCVIKKQYLAEATG